MRLEFCIIHLHHFFGVRRLHSFERCTANHEGGFKLSGRGYGLYEDRLPRSRRLQNVADLNTRAGLNWIGALLEPY